jgi:hypothetical protein
VIPDWELCPALNTYGNECGQDNGASNHCKPVREGAIRPSCGLAFFQIGSPAVPAADAAMKKAITFFARSTKVDEADPFSRDDWLLTLAAGYGLANLTDYLLMS